MPAWAKKKKIEEPNLKTKESITVVQYRIVAK